MSEQQGENLCEAELLENLRRGDRRSQEFLVRHHGPKILAVAKRYMGNEDDAADVFQEAFMRIFNGIENFEGRSSLLHWMRCVAVRVCLTNLRKIKNRKELCFEDWCEQDVAGTSPAPVVSCSVENTVEELEVNAYVRDAVDSLPETYRAILLLRDFLGASTMEAAETLAIEPNAARVRLHRARNALRDSLNLSIDQYDLVSWFPKTSTVNDQPVAA